MKTKNNSYFTVIRGLLMVLPLFLIVLFALSSCATKKKSASVQTAITPPPPPTPTPTQQGFPVLPPPPSNSINKPSEKSGDDMVTFVEEKPDSLEEDTPFVVVEEMPIFQGGDSALLEYLGKNTQYPDSAKANSIQGCVIVRFCVTKEGGVNRIAVLKGVSPELDAEAIRVVGSLPAFKPGKQGGKPVNVWYMVPISFALK